MRAWLLSLSLLAPAVGEEPKGVSGQLAEMGPSVMQAIGVMQMGNYKQALSQFEAILEEHPDNRRLHLLIGQTYFAMNDCVAGEQWVLQHRKRPAFRIRTAALIAACHARHGEYAEAVYWQEEAALLDPGTASVWSLLGIYRYRQGDYWGADEALREAAMVDPGDMRLAYAYATIALSDGDHSNIDELIGALRAAPYGALHSYVLEARLELDLGNPVRAAELADEATRRDLGGASGLTMKAEALRRQGAGEDADQLLARRTKWFKQRPAMWAVQARVWVDIGKRREAADLLTSALDVNPLDPELVASAWYLSRAEGDSEAMAAWAVDYDTFQACPYRPLSALVPLTESLD
ncbi:MAG TPA: tetratricopeptide repeat protein [Myxococcota bacterium]|nr:tetratricopeptide repeat protein [Myxococcota bacterium]